MAILVTGGAGFIGSHTCAELLEGGHEVVVIDDYSNSSPAALDAVRWLTHRPVIVHEIDVRDRLALAAVFARYPIEAVIHFAAKKAVAESLRIPVDYFDINVAGTTNLLRVMLEHGVGRLVFSSSCSIYGAGHSAPIAEDDPVRPANPYARSKLICEQILAAACDRYPDLSVVALRYFNPVGAHPSGLLGEDPRGVPSNLMPYMLRVAAGRLRRLPVYGGDYDTPDGSAVRDYVHVADVAGAHRAAVDHLDDEAGLRAFNLGTGAGVSVLQLVAAFQEACGVAIPFDIAERRPGDVATLVAKPAKIENEWGWRTHLDLAAMCRDAWRFQQLNPRGYAGNPAYTG
jgi:UDP-glucose 4-epimerase